MKLIALLAVKNEELYLRYCLQNLISQGFDVYLIDNESTDDTVKIAKEFLNKGVITIDSLKTNGIFNLMKTLQYKESITNALDADWFMHTDADEIRLPHPPFKTIKEAVKKIESLGYNAVNFNAYYFLPEKGKSYVDRDYNKEMRYYYFHSPHPLTHIKLWKNERRPMSFGVSGGHQVSFEGMRIYPNPFILKHFIFLSEEHGIEKYSRNRKLPEDEVKKLGWHGFRANFKKENFYIPSKSELKKLTDNNFDTSDPKIEHPFYKMDEKQVKEEKSQEVHEESINNELVQQVPPHKENQSNHRVKVRIKIYSFLLSIYRRLIPFRLRQKIKNILMNTANY